MIILLMIIIRSLRGDVERPVCVASVLVHQLFKVEGLRWRSFSLSGEVAPGSTDASALLPQWMIQRLIVLNVSALSLGRHMALAIDSFGEAVTIGELRLVDRIMFHGGQLASVPRPLPHIVVISTFAGE